MSKLSIKCHPSSTNKDGGLDVEVCDDLLDVYAYGDYGAMASIGRDEAKKLGQFIADYTKCPFAPEPEIAMEFTDYIWEDPDMFIAGKVSCKGHYNDEVECIVTHLNPHSFVNMIMEWDTDVVDALIYVLSKRNKNRE